MTTPRDPKDGTTERLDLAREGLMTDPVSPELKEEQMASVAKSASEGLRPFACETPCQSEEVYRGFRIDYAPPPIPTRESDWQWVHEDYDGPEDNRCGHAPSLEAAKADIDFWHEENDDAG